MAGCNMIAKRRHLDTPKMVWGSPRLYHVPLGSRERAYLVDKSETDLIAVAVRWLSRESHSHLLHHNFNR
jgi:hypothetical protein